MSFPSSSSSSPSPSEPAEEKVAKFETFVNDVLKDSLKQIFKAIEVVNDEITDLQNARDSIESMCSLSDEAAASGAGKPLKTRVNVGCDYYMQANVDVRKFMVCVGLGYYVEFTRDEALEHIRHRTKKLRDHEQDLRDKGARVRAQITLALHCIQQLQGL